MAVPDHVSLAMQVAILAPTGKDAQLTAAVLREASVESLICPDLRHIEQAVQEGVGILLVAEEALGDRKIEALAAALSTQPPWSDLPVLLLTRYGADSSTVSQAIQLLDNVTLLERPVRPATLLSVVRSALKARKRQYQVRDHLLEREQVEEALRQADRRKDEFLAMLAHELRNPLAPIRTGLEVLKLTKDDPATVEEICHTMERQMQQLISLVDDLLDVSRITRGKINLRKCPVLLSDVVQSAVEASHHFVEEAGHELTLAMPEHPIHLDADPHRLAQVLSNLLNNAAKYTPQGGHIWLTAERQGSHVLLTVKDTGIGIPADMRDHIFDMFSQIDRPLEKGYTGLGIGLTLVKSLVEMHDGRIEVRSEGPERGSEFSVRLPILMERPVEDQNRGPADQTPVRPSPRRVLVVDDNEAAAKMLSMAVKMLGHEVRTAHDGQEAIQVAAEFLPDIVLMDLGMPNMNGYEAASYIRQQPWSENLVLIALTGWGQDEDKRRTKAAGFDQHLVKPTETSELRRVLGESTPSEAECRSRTRGEQK